MNSEHGKLLVVDDNEMNRDMLSRRLGRKGHSVVTAEDGRAALERIQQEPFELVLLDIEMPGMDGFEVLRTIRETFDASDLPVVMATARTESDDIVRALKSGANDYVTKPLDFPVVQVDRAQTQRTGIGRRELQGAVDRVDSPRLSPAFELQRRQAHPQRRVVGLLLEGRIQHRDALVDATPQGEQVRAFEDEQVRGAEALLDTVERALGLVELATAAQRTNQQEV